VNAEMDVDQTWQALARGDLLEVINMWWWSGFACGFRLTFSFSSPLRNRGFLDICWHFSYNQRPMCTILGEMTDADKIMGPQYFGTDPTDMRIRINPKIRIWIPDHFWFICWHWQRFVLSECSCFRCSHAWENTCNCLRGFRSAE